MQVVQMGLHFEHICTLGGTTPSGHSGGMTLAAAEGPWWIADFKWGGGE